VQDEEAEAAVPAGCLELGYELGTPVDLDRFDGEGHALKDRIQEARPPRVRWRGCGPPVLASG
jgi:hypothetical protein